ncbi:response regulator transcription factor [Aromatoleum toluclasticum]|uniref:hypothetical protein n=1 Tax=Aromatoleum toluclasticum TaxID=92003 RepID=UPI00036542F5|nr:hypothetical protein [Aromatoleum toluclasticum]
MQDWLKQRGSHLPVNIYTRNANIPATVHAVQARTFAVIEKPLSSDLLNAYV